MPHETLSTGVGIFRCAFGLRARAVAVCARARLSLCTQYANVYAGRTQPHKHNLKNALCRRVAIKKNFATLFSKYSPLERSLSRRITIPVVVHAARRCSPPFVCVFDRIVGCIAGRHARCVRCSALCHAADTYSARMHARTTIITIKYPRMIGEAAVVVVGVIAVACATD